MKTLRLTLIALVAAASASASFAGPGPQYWAARRADRAQAKVTAPFVSAEKCKTMTTRQGNVTRTVDCTGAVAETAACKAACDK